MERGKVVRFSTRFRGILASNRRACLASFNLMLSRDFTLSMRRCTFFGRGAICSCKRVLLGLNRLVLSSCGSYPRSSQGELVGGCSVRGRLQPSRLEGLLLRGVRSVRTRNVVFLSRACITDVIGCHEVVSLVRGFLTRVSDGPEGSAIFPRMGLQSLLRRVNLLSRTNLSARTIWFCENLSSADAGIIREGQLLPPCSEICGD